MCIVVEDDLKRFSCEQCEFTSDRRYSLQRHMERKHPDLQKTGYNLKQGGTHKTIEQRDDI